MRRFLSIGFCLSFFISVQAFAGEEMGNPMAPVHNEYHNSTIYSSQVRDSTPDPREGIHVYIDPDTGDRVVSVRSRREPEAQSQQPFYIEPIIRP